MPRKKKVSVEIVPVSEANLVPKLPAADLPAMLDRMVRDRVDQIMAERGAGELEPDYQPKRVLVEIQGSKTVFDRRKWAMYFEKWGCKVCGRKKNVSHMCKGRCGTCNVRIGLRLAQLKLEYERNNPESQIAEDIDRLTRRIRSAEALLGEGE